MARAQKAKRVSWPPDVNLCQVRLFLSEEAPSQSGSAAQDHLQAKTSWLLHSAGAGSDDGLPPGFGVPQSSISKISSIKWRCPPRMLLDVSWQVAEGGESKEVEIQTQRELKVLEAVYPRPSAIPTGPTVSAEVSGSHYDDSKTPLIPVTPVEDDDNMDSFDSLQPLTALPTISVPAGILPNSLPHVKVPSSAVEFPLAEVQQLSGNAISIDKPAIGILPTSVKPDVLAAAQAAFTAIVKTNEEGSLIDHELLIKILSNPSLIEQLLKDYGPPLSTNPMILPNQLPAPVPIPTPPTIRASPFEPDVPLSGSSPLAPTISVQLNPVTNPIVPTSISPRPISTPARPISTPARPISTPAASTSTVTPAHAVKDLNYYKSLIQQHGEERREDQNHTSLPFGSRPEYNNNLGANVEVVQQNARPRDSRGKKPCLFFNTPKGCRNGVNCVYLHDPSLPKRMNNIGDSQNAKRMKLDGEITGRS